MEFHIFGPYLLVCYNSISWFKHTSDSSTLINVLTISPITNNLEIIVTIASLNLDFGCHIHCFQLVLYDIILYLKGFHNVHADILK